MYNFAFRLTALSLLCLALCSAQHIYAQKGGNKPERLKIGLALSGGGAKGLAYIGLLEVIDSLGLKIDYISGTSAGGIFGGLYAMGYSADTLKKMALNINWKRILSNKAPLDKINIEEKDEYDNYMIEFPVSNGKPHLPNSLIDGQYMSEILNTLTYPAKHINDFNRLPIPITITSSDIINGGLVLQHSGSLGMAIRATLAIPAAFSPVYIDGKLLVDGGLDRNFPVQEVKAMGAEYIIGGYTGFRLFTEEEIENPMKLIYQTHAFRSVEDSKKQMEMVNLLIDFTEPLRAYTTANFFKNKAIIEIGEREAKKYIPMLKKLADEQRKYQLEPQKVIVDPHLKIDKIVYQNDKGQPLNMPVIEQFVSSRIGLKTGNDYKVGKINKGIDDVYGTQFFNKVYYTFENNADTGLTMNIRLKNGGSGVFKAGIHYDTEQSIGAIVNYTYRNIFLRKSRILATVDFSESFKARGDYYKFINENNRLWLKVSTNFKSLRNNYYLYRILSNNSYFINTFNSELALGYSLNGSSAISSSIGNETMAVRSGTSYVKRFLSDAPDQRTYYKHSNQTFALLFKQNSLDYAYYPKEGNMLTIQAKYFFNYDYSIQKPDSTNEQSLMLYNEINPSDRLPGATARFYLNESFVSKITSKLSLMSTLSWGFLYSQKQGFRDYIYENSRFSLGGVDTRYDIGQLNFVGIQRDEVDINNYSLIGLSLQYNPFGKIYLSPQANVIFSNKGANPFVQRSKDDNLIGYGLNFGYMSLLGPINLSLAKTNGFFQKSLRAYLSMGFKF